VTAVPGFEDDLREAHDLLAREHVLELGLDRCDRLLDGDERRESGIDRLAGVLASARRLPDALTVRLVTVDPDGVRALVEPFRACCRERAARDWRQAMSLRRNGRRQLPRAVLAASGFGLFAAVVGYGGDSIEPRPVVVILFVVAGISTIAAWASAWLPIEQALFDWRAPAHEAAAYALLACAELEIVRPPGGPSGPNGHPAAVGYEPWSSTTRPSTSS
jgi:hypothetical protein